MKPQIAFDICHSRVLQFQAEQHALRVIRADASCSGGPTRVGNVPTEYIADFYKAAQRAITLTRLPHHIRRRVKYYSNGMRKKRLAIFRAYFLNFPPKASFDDEVTNADLLNAHAKVVMETMEIKEGTFWSWVDDIKRDVGQELMRVNLFPPSNYRKLVEVEAYVEPPPIEYPTAEELEELRQQQAHVALEL